MGTEPLMPFHTHWMLTVSQVTFLELGYAARNSIDADLRPLHFSVKQISIQFENGELLHYIYGRAWLDWVNGRKKLVTLNRL